MENKRFIRRQARANQRKLDITLRQLTNGLLTAEQRHTIIHRLNIKKQYRLRLCVKPIRISDLTAVIDRSGTLQILLGDPLAACVHEANETRRRLPVMSQMAWFRLKYPEGRIAVTVTAAKDCFVASARIYAHYNLPPDQYLAEATASRGYLPDKPTVSPREWAQTAAVGIALRNAGFGLQFSAAGDSFDTPAVDELGAITWSTAPAGEAPTVGPTAPVPAPATTAPAPTAPELSPLEKAMRIPCPITRYKDKTLGDMVAADPNALVWIATKFTGDAEVIAAAKLICDQALASA